MKKIYLQILTIVLAFVFIFGAGGVYAAWAYAEGDVSDVQVSLNMELGVFSYWEGSETLSPGEQASVQGFVDAMNNETEREVIESVVSDRTSVSRYMNEVGSMDPDAETNDTYKQMLKILGLEENPNVSVVIRFVKGGFLNMNITGYEVYTTTFDLSTLDESDFDNEVYKVYPVNKTTFTQNGDMYSISATSVVCCRAMWYYKDNNNQYDGTNGNEAIRSFDVTQTRTNPPDGWQG